MSDKEQFVALLQRRWQLRAVLKSIEIELKQLIRPMINEYHLAHHLAKFADLPYHEHTFRIIDFYTQERDKKLLLVIKIEYHPDDEYVFFEIEMEKFLSEERAKYINELVLKRIADENNN